MIKIDNKENNEFNINDEDEELEDNIFDNFDGKMDDIDNPEIAGFIQGNLEGLDPESLENLDQQIREDRKSVV